MWLNIAAIALGVVIWWLYYGVECFLNGAVGGWWLPFAEAWRELKWNLPIVGWTYRLADANGDAEWAAMLPGPIHFVFTCVVLPLVPLGIVIAVRAAAT